MKLEKGSKPPALLYVLYPSRYCELQDYTKLIRKYSGKWRIQAVSVEEGSFTSRLPLPESWRGVRGDELSKLTGIPGCVFAHANGEDIRIGNHRLIHVLCVLDVLDRFHRRK